MAKTNYAEFCVVYNLWLADCIAEYNEKYGENRKYWCYPEDDVEYVPGDIVEFAENGDAYPHGAGGTNWIPKAVTPWSESEHHID